MASEKSDYGLGSALAVAGAGLALVVARLAPSNSDLFHNGWFVGCIVMAILGVLILLGNAMKNFIDWLGHYWPRVAAWLVRTRARIPVRFQWPIVISRIPQAKRQFAIEVVNAKYGADEGSWIDVTEKVRQRIVNGRLIISADNSEFGDPCPGIVKQFVLTYRLGDDQFEESFGESSLIELPRTTS